MYILYYKHTFGYYYHVFDLSIHKKNYPGSAGGDISYWLVPGTYVED